MPGPPRIAITALSKTNVSAAVDQFEPIIHTGEKIAHAHHHTASRHAPILPKARKARDEAKICTGDRMVSRWRHRSHANRVRNGLREPRAGSNWLTDQARGYQRCLFKYAARNVRHRVQHRCRLRAGNSWRNLRGCRQINEGGPRRR